MSLSTEIGRIVVFPRANELASSRLYVYLRHQRCYRALNRARCQICYRIFETYINLSLPCLRTAGYRLSLYYLFYYFLILVVSFIFQYRSSLRSLFNILYTARAKNIWRSLNILVNAQCRKSAAHITRCICVYVPYRERFDYPWFTHRHLENKHGILVYIYTRAVARGRARHIKYPYKK